MVVLNIEKAFKDFTKFNAERAAEISVTLDEDKVEDDSPVQITRTYTPQEERKLKLDELLTPERLKVMRNYLRIRSSTGAAVDRLDDEEVRDMYVSRIRNFEQTDVGPLDEALFLKRIDESQFGVAADAYALAEELGNVFQSGSGLKQTAFGVAEIVGNVLNPFESPTILAGGVGKIVGSVAGKTTAGLIKELVKKGSKEALEKGLKGKAKKEIVQQAVKQGLKNKRIKEVAIAAGADSAAAVGIDYIYQDSLRKVGVQEGHSALQSGLAATGGILGGGVALATTAKTTKVTIKGKSTGYNSNFISDAKKATRKDRKKLKKEVDEGVLKAAKSWFEKTKQGTEYLIDNDEPTIAADFMKTILLGNTDNNITGFMKLLDDRGIVLKKFKRLNLEDVDGKPLKDKRGRIRTEVVEVKISDAVTDALLELPDPIKDELLKIVNKSLMYETINNHTPFKSFDAFINVLAKTTGDTGQILNVWSQAQKIVKGSKNYLRAKREEEAASAISDTFSGQLSYFQNIWKRTVVSAFSTSVLNLKGFAGITALNTIGDLARAAVHMPISSIPAMIKLSKGDTQGALREFSKSKHIMQNQAQRLANLLDPNGTVNMFKEIMKIDKQSARHLNKIIAAGTEGGQSLEELARRYKFFKKDKNGKILTDKKSKREIVDVDNKLLKTGEAYVGTAQKVMLVDTADMFMKSQSFIGNLDMVLRNNSNVSLRQISELPVKERLKFIQSKEFLEASAETTDITLQDVLSKSYRSSKKTKTFVTDLAGVIEDFGNVPIIGTLFPFGKFFNNTVAFTYNLMGGSIIGASIELTKNLASKRGATLGLQTQRKLGVTGAAGVLTTIGTSSFADKEQDEDTYKNMLNSAASYSLLGLVRDQDREKQELGLQWYEFKKDDGDIVDVRFDFPFSQFALLARLLNVKEQGAEISKELQTAALEQFTIGQLQRNLGKVGNISRLLQQYAEDDMDSLEEMTATSLGTLISSPISGIMRPFDPINRLAGYFLGDEAESMDARQASSRVIFDSTRYVNNIFELFTGSQMATSKKIMTRKGDIVPQSPLSDASSLRTRSPLTYTEMMLGDSNLEEWTQKIKTQYPKGDGVFNQYIAPTLERYSRVMVESSIYKNASPDKKLELKDYVLKSAKKEIKLKMQRGAFGKRGKRVFNLQKLADAKPKLLKEALVFNGYEPDLSIDDIAKLDDVKIETIVTRLKDID